MFRHAGFTSAVDTSARPDFRAGIMYHSSARKLVAEVELSQPTVQRMKTANGVSGGLTKNLDLVQRIFEGAGRHPDGQSILTHDHA